MEVGYFSGLGVAKILRGNGVFCKVFAPER
jgi:hypothetical protein